MMEWGHPEYFIWLWTLPAVLFIFLLSSWRKGMEIRRIGEAALVRKLISSFSPWMRLAKRCLLILSLLFIVLGLCQPHFKKKDVLVERKGIDVVIAVDVSNSMLAKDIQPTRLDKAKLELSGLIDKLKTDRIGIVAFAGDAFIQCPLTLDKNAAKLFLNTISPNIVTVQGTDLTKALQVATQAFGEKNEGGKAVILLTDGENLEEDPLDAAKAAFQKGIHVFTIGIGTSDGSTLPNAYGAQGYKKDRQGQIVLSKLNEPLLKALARNTEGMYYRATRGELETDKLLTQLSRLAQKDFKSQWLAEYEENYQFFLILAILLLLAEQFLSERRWK